MLSPNILNKAQSSFNLERLNEQYYRALASAAAVVNRPGAEVYFKKCAADEADHTRRVHDYIVDRNCEPMFTALPDLPKISGEDYGGMFRMALQREVLTTANYNEFWLMVDDKEPDPQTVAFITIPDGDFPGFLQEQTDSEREITDYLLKIDRLSPDGLEIFDQWLEEKVG